MTGDIPTHLKPHSSKSFGRYERQPADRAPRCPHCDARYRAASTREQITWYYPTCDCAPRSGIVRLRPQRSQ
jgi:hypothetical protein